MRVSSLSDSRVIEMLSDYFIPVSLSRDRYQSEPLQDKDASILKRVDYQSEQRGLDRGSVCVYLLDGEGDVLDSLRVERAWDPENLLPFLGSVVVNENPAKATRTELLARNESLQGTVSNQPGRHGGDRDLVLHIATRFDERRVHWGLSEDWLRFSPLEWHEWIRVDPDLQIGDSWSASSKASTRLLSHFYPPTNVWDVNFGRIQEEILVATLAERGTDDWLIRLQGSIRLAYPFKLENGGVPGTVTADLIGYVRYLPATKSIVSFKMISTEARYEFVDRGIIDSSEMSIAVENVDQTETPE